MSNRKTTKRALLTSVMALVMCVVMLVGTTFAWFTDTASTGVNKIQAGNLKMEVEYRTSDNESIDSGVWKPLKDATDLFGTEDTRFEPGHTRVVELKIHNAGNLAFKYKIGMNVVSEQPGTSKDGNEYKLSNYLKVANTAIQAYPAEGGIAAALEWAMFHQRGNGSMWKQHDFANFELEKADNGEFHNLLPGNEVILGMKVYMPEDVGNEANARTIDEAASISFGLNILATQYTVERDSFGSDYDKDATYPTLISTSQDMIDAMKRGGTVTVGDITLDGEIGADGNVNPDREMQLVNAGDIDLTLDGTVTSGNISGYAWGCMRVMPGTKLVISAGENGKFINTATQSNINVCGGDVVVNGGYFESAGYGFFVYTDSDAAIAAGTSLTINGGTFKANWGVVYVAMSNATVTINGGTFIGWDPTPYVNAETHTVTNTNGTYTVTAK